MTQSKGSDIQNNYSTIYLNGLRKEYLPKSSFIKSCTSLDNSR